MSYECVSEGAYDGVYCVTVHATCHMCRQKSVFHIPECQWLRWTQEGALIQNAIPSLSDADRELLISGTCGKCFDELFSDDENEEDAPPSCPECGCEELHKVYGVLTCDCDGRLTEILKDEAADRKLQEWKDGERRINGKYRGEK